MKATHYVLSENTDVILIKIVDDSTEKIVEYSPSKSVLGIANVIESSLSVGQFDNLSPVDIRENQYEPIADMISSSRDSFDNLFSNL